MNSNNISNRALEIFKTVIDQYHVLNTVDQIAINPFSEGTFDYLLYKKNWIDTVQWHYEDLIRDPNIDPKKGMELKRKIDSSNQDRTDMVEYIDSYFLDKNYEMIKDKKDLTECKVELDRLKSIHNTYQKRMEKSNQELLQHC